MTKRNYKDWDCWRKNISKSMTKKWAERKKQELNKEIEESPPWVLFTSIGLGMILGGLLIAGFGLPITYTWPWTTYLGSLLLIIAIISYFYENHKKEVLTWFGKTKRKKKS